MPRGGARSRSGPPPDPKSERSERRRARGELGARFGRLPRGGFTGRVPAWPLADASPRERQVWKDAWRTPQAAAWSTEPWRWRSVALWVRWSVRMEDAGANAATASAALRLADQIGLTPLGLRENGWEIEEAPGSRVLAEASPDAKPAQGKTPRPPAAVPIRDRLKVVKSAGGE